MYTLIAYWFILKCYLRINVSLISTCTNLNSTQ